MFSVKIDPVTKRIIAYDSMDLRTHASLGRDADPLYRFVDRTDFRTESRLVAFLVSPTHHYFDGGGVLRRIVNPSAL